MTEEKSIKFTRTLINDCYSLGLYQVPRDLILSKHKCSSLITSCHSFAKVYMSVDPANDSKIRVRIITDKASLNQTIDTIGILDKIQNFGQPVGNRTQNQEKDICFPAPQKTRFLAE